MLAISLLRIGVLVRDLVVSPVGARLLFFVSAAVGSLRVALVASEALLALRAENLRFSSLSLTHSMLVILGVLVLGALLMLRPLFVLLATLLLIG